MKQQEIKQLHDYVDKINNIRWDNENLTNIYPHPEYHYYVIVEIWKRCNELFKQINFDKVSPTFQSRDNKNDNILRVLKDIYGDLSIKKQYGWLIPLFYDCERFLNLQVDSLVPSEPKSSKGLIFLSHSSKDQKIVKDFKDRILNLGLHIDDERIFFSSSIGTDIKTGKDFNSVIISKLKNASVVILFLSENYEESPICLNEMGAAKALNKRLIPLLLPNNDFKQIGFLSKTEVQLKIDKSSNLHKFRQDIVNSTNKNHFNASSYNEQIDKFILAHKKTIQPRKK